MKLKIFLIDLHATKAEKNDMALLHTTISQFSNSDSKEFFPIVLKVHDRIQFSENFDGLTILSKKKLQGFDFRVTILLAKTF